MRKILIVDDESVMLELMNMVLSKDYETVCASSGKEAVELFEKERPDMILSDLMMPEMSGYELQQIIQENSSRQIPFIFMTADESDESENRGFQLGAADYIRKPLKSDLLLRRIERIFHQVDQVDGWKKKASIDAMTGLLNKSASKKEIGAACAEKQGVLMMIDLDSFKLVNDIYGHEMGDRILIRFSSLIKSIIRENDIAGRMGGDEFIAFCQNLREESIIARKTAYLNEELVKSAKEYMGEDMEIPLGASIGAVIVPDAGTHFEELFQKADAALYNVKQRGKHGYELYKGELHHEEKETVNGFESIRMIFGERNPGRGAYVADREHFQTIYRFLARFIHNYSWDIRFALFTLESKTTAEISRAAEQFCEMAKQCLRSSDVILKYNKNQVLILLMKVDGENCEIPIARVMDKWKQEGDHEVSITCESEPIDA